MAWHAGEACALTDTNDARPVLNPLLLILIDRKWQRHVLYRWPEGQCSHRLSQIPAVSVDADRCVISIKFERGYMPKMGACLGCA